MQLYLQNYLKEDPGCRSSINQFQGFVRKKFWLHQTRIGLSFYDCAGLGYLKECHMVTIRVLIELHVEELSKEHLAKMYLVNLHSPFSPIIHPSIKVNHLYPAAPKLGQINPAIFKY